MVKKIKSPSCGPSWCQNHVFQLNPLKTYLYFNKKSKLRLCPKHNKAYNTFDHALPVLNYDKKHYTPLFILEEQKNFYREHDQRAQCNHQKLVQRDQQDYRLFQMGSLNPTFSFFNIHQFQYQPKHGGQKPYCLVCEKAYSDYYEHINSHDHKKNLDNNIFTRYIMQIQQNLKKQQKESLNIATPLKQNQTAKQEFSDINKRNLSQKGRKMINLQRILQTERTKKHTLELDRLQMQHIESHYVDITTLKEIYQIIDI